MSRSTKPALRDDPQPDGSAPPDEGDARQAENSPLQFPRLRAWAATVPWRTVGAFASILLFAAVLFVLHRLVDEVKLDDVKTAIAATPWSSVAIALAASMASYVALTGYDWFGILHIKRRDVGYPVAALASFTGYALSYTIGFQLVVAGAVRYRIYAGAGLGAAEVAAITAISALTLWLGIFFTLAIGLVLEAPDVARIDGLSPALNMALGLAIFAALAAYLIWIGRRERAVTVEGYRLALPGVKSTGAQIVIGLVDLLGAAFALWILLPPQAEIAFPTFAALFVVGMTLGMLSHAPGGAGVIEATVLIALPNLPADAVLASLLLWRVVYYLIPFMLALGLLGGSELARRKGYLSRAGTMLAAVMRPVAPIVLAAAVFLGGIVLLVSGALPAETDRLHYLRRVVPLPFVEASHLLASVVGVVLLVVARGLLRRLDSAYRVAQLLLTAGLVFSLAKGFDVEEASVLGVVLALLTVNRRAFYRRASLWDQDLAPAWLAAVAIVLGGSIWLGFFAYRNVDYSNEMWWEFAYRSDAPRFLRASLAAGVAALAIGLHALLHRHGKPRPAPAEPARRLTAIVATSPRADANLAFLGDKRFLFSEAGDAFIMYQVQGRSWVAMGDPVGPPERASELLWSFRELADQHGGWPVFYQASVARLPMYLDLGLSLMKLGEEARVDLKTFTLEGKAGYEWRYVDRKATKEGLEISIVPAADAVPLYPELKRVSDAWMGSRKSREKGFSLGFWSDDYLRHFDIAVARHRGRVVGFANLWKGAGLEEATVDLMRYSPDAPKGVMDALFVRLMLWAKAEGYRWFNLGMAPLSGLVDHPLGPTWSRVGAFLFRYGDNFYNFEGLRTYKSKFSPVWEPRYLACPGGWVLPQILIDITALIGDAPKRVLTPPVVDRPLAIAEEPVV
ncbi:bifunctional lysylphosphatidylglycerol flippase/synthetase MprF [Hansschlegelia zhihuaiae]|uniref:Phosphatidylglycerol lysyltransferase n=1 Tax=Hansschlegelia zhihuaiae TaxID=405005 RepID=A0A4Q0MP27_9HYPH|nr:bifunctional lysylphosphatidylglycerol flippase/synthetase MprF [Hansschlegelia zhihuaiae]RXF75647.1 bifunctional lysylphosphatidylglycerol flippase/synthetase MprF [Hansschlegelia zhihuaiae]